MTTTVEILTEDTPDTPPDFPTDSAPIRCIEDGCTNAVTKPARGRTPKKCDEHRAATGGKTSTGSRKASWPNAETVELALGRYLSGLAFVVTMVNPADGTVIAQGSGPVAKELVELGRQDKKIRDVLEKITKPGKYGPMLMALAPIIVGILANHNLLPQFILTPTSDTEGEKP